MGRRVVPLAAMLTVAPSLLHAQTVRARLDVIGLTYQEARDGRDAQGEGLGAGLEFRFKRFGLDARVYSAEVRPDEAGRQPYDFVQVDVRVQYHLTPFLALEAGGGRRYVTPELATQAVGLTRLGVLSENRMNRISSVWFRGAYLLDTRFDGGGNAEVAFEFGLGVAVGTANGRFRFQAEYEFQRIDREVASRDVPIQLSVARIGLAFGV